MCHFVWSGRKMDLLYLYKKKCGEKSCEQLETVSANLLWYNLSLINKNKLQNMVQNFNFQPISIEPQVPLLWYSETNISRPICISESVRYNLDHNFLREFVISCYGMSWKISHLLLALLLHRIGRKMESSVALPLPTGQLKELVDNAKDYAASHGRRYILSWHIAQLDTLLIKYPFWAKKWLEKYRYAIIYFPHNFDSDTLPIQWVCNMPWAIYYKWPSEIVE